MAAVQKQCLYCKKYYPEDTFGVALTTPQKIYRRRKCRDCYRTTKRVLIDRYFGWLVEYKESRGCSRCGVRDYRILDFHHENEETKLFTIGGFRRSVGFKRITNEVKKCIVLCANCHRILHDEQRKNKSIGA